MREGLRSSARQKRKSEMLDLNKEPSENKVPSADSSASDDYFSAEESRKDLDSSVNMVATCNGDGDNVGEVDRGEGKEENNSKSDGGNSEGAEGKMEALGYINNAADNGFMNDEIWGEAVGNKGLGRKRKVAGSGLSGDGSEEIEEPNEENAKMAKTGEHEGKRDVADLGRDVAANAGCSTDGGRKEASKGRRGRKRKVSESSCSNTASEDVREGVGKLAVDTRPQIVGRVLRSRTMAVTDGEKQAFREGNAGVGDQKNELDVDQSEKISTKVKIDKSTRPAKRGRKILKGRRGRPPKNHRKNENLKVTLGRKIKIGSQSNINQPRAEVVRGSNLVRDYKKKVTSELTKLHDEKSNQKNDGEMGRNEEKQLLRNQITSILKAAGWTIERRPRMNRDYFDAVYVDHRGRTYWSVTLAYKTLKQMVEDGTADAKAISAFTPIPEDELRKLYRISKEKGKKQKKLGKAGASKDGKGPNKTSAARSTALSKSTLNAKSHLGEKLSRKKKGDSSEQENSVVFSGRRKSKSRREGGRKPCALMARCSENDHGADGFKMYNRKHTLLSWMIECGTISLGGKVLFICPERTVLTLDGKITSEGISCGCCGKVVTFVDFESHAGSTLCQPFQNIYLESGHSLVQCMRKAWSKQEESNNIGFHYVNVDGEDPHDDTCNICADGGDLTCCDGCPSTFHHSCLQTQNAPVGYWRCAYCSCKFCGMVCGGASLSDDVADMGDFINDHESFTCYFCQQKFHVHCRLGKDGMGFNSEDLSFCGKGCHKLFERLKKLLGVRHELEAGYSWTILRRQDVSMDNSHNADSSEIVCNSKLAIALSIMDECFEPIIDSRTNIDVIQSVIYSCGSNFRRLNFWRFYTFILERGDEVVSAAAVRVHGNQLAEMPFIGTLSAYRRQGMCRRLLTAIETALSSLDVEKLVIPAVSELSETWTKVFGFLPIEESMRQEMKYTSMIAFPGADMLQKPLSKHQVTEGRTSAIGMQLIKPIIEHVQGAITPARNVDGFSVDMLQEENVEAADGVGSSGNITDGCVNDNHGVTNEVEFSISSENDNLRDIGGPLELRRGVETLETFRDKSVSLTFTTVAHKTSSDPTPSSEISSKSISRDSLPYHPQPCMKSLEQSGSALWDSEMVCKSTAYSEVAFEPTTRSCNTGAGPERDPNVDC